MTPKQLDIVLAMADVAAGDRCTSDSEFKEVEEAIEAVCTFGTETGPEMLAICVEAAYSTTHDTVCTIHNSTIKICDCVVMRAREVVAKVEAGQGEEPT